MDQIFTTLKIIMPHKKNFKCIKMKMYFLKGQVSSTPPRKGNKNETGIVLFMLKNCFLLMVCQ